MLFQMQRYLLLLEHMPSNKPTKLFDRQRTVVAVVSVEEVPEMVVDQETNPAQQKKRKTNYHERISSPIYLRRI